MIRRCLTFRPALIYGIVLLWTFHFSFGAFLHYHPEYTHGHDGSLEAHHHTGHFHSLELDRLAQFFEPGVPPLHPGEHHHHSESLPGSDPESVQFELNPSNLPKVKLAADVPLDSAPVVQTAEPGISPQFLQPPSEIRRILLFPQSRSERSPPRLL